MKTVFDDDELKVVNGRNRVLKYSLGTNLNSCYNSNITIIMYLVLGSCLNKKFTQTLIGAFNFEIIWYLYLDTSKFKY